VQRLTRARSENPALRPVHFATDGVHTPSASLMAWFDQNGETMSEVRWTDPAHRTLQYVAVSTPETEECNRILLIVHGDERPIDVTLPPLDDVTGYVSLWSSAQERPSDEREYYRPGDVVATSPTSMHLFRAV
jgi:glycogen operon protein